MSCFALLFFMYCTNGLLNLPIHVQLSVQSPPFVVKGLIILNGLQRLRLNAGAEDLFSGEQKTFHPEEGFLVLDGAQDAESRCCCWSTANLCRRPRTRMVHINRGTEKCLLFRCEFQMGGRTIKSI